MADFDHKGVQRNYELTTLTSNTLDPRDIILRPTHPGATGAEWSVSAGLLTDAGQLINDRLPTVISDNAFFADAVNPGSLSVPLTNVEEPATGPVLADTSFVSANTGTGKIRVDLNWALTGYTSGDFQLFVHLTDSAGTAITDQWQSGSGNKAQSTDQVALTLNAHGLTVNTAADWQTHRLVFTSSAESDGTELIAVYAAAVVLETATVNNVGNLLVGAVTIDKDSGTINDPTGWTPVEKGNSVSNSLGMWYRIATGDANDIFVPSWVNAQQSEAHVGEWEINSTGVAVDWVDITQTESVVTGVTVDLDPATSPGLLVGFAGIDSDKNSIAFDTLTALEHEVSDHQSGIGQSTGAFGERIVAATDGRAVTTTWAAADQNGLILAQFVLTGATVPDAVDDLAGVAGDSQVVLTWTAPADGGSAITDYVVEFREV